MTDDFESMFFNAAYKFGCDKVTAHSYEGAYARHLARYQNVSDLKILEIGVGGEGYASGGASLQMWSEIFPQANVYGLDIFDKSFLNVGKIKTFILDQGDSFALKSFAEEYGPFDIIVDDGSHMRSDVLTSLFNLFVFLKPNGVYVIEDLMTSYWPKYGGSTLARNVLDTPLSWTKNLIDVVHRNDMLSIDERLPQWNIKAVCVYAGIAFIEAGAPRVLTNLPDSPDFFKNQISDDCAMYGNNAKLYEGVNFDFFNTLEKIKSGDI